MSTYRPVIGITTYAVDTEWRDWKSPSVLTPRPYVDRVAHAGALPILLSPQTLEFGAIDQALGLIDGLMLIGGEDLCGRWSSRVEPADLHNRHSDERDEFEVAIARAAWEADMPMLGICRGLQVLNVARGGTLIDDLPSAGASEVHLMQRGTFNPHPVKYEASATPGLFDPAASVPSHHHQAIDRLGDGLRVVGRAHDEVIEAVESQGKRFVVGVQWHPEEGADGRLFGALVSAAKGQAA